MRKIDTDNILNIINSKSKEKTIILLSRDTCPDCIKYFPIIKSALKQLPKDYNVYYFDTDLNRSNENLVNLVNDLNVQYVPTIILLEGGEVKVNIYGEELSNQSHIVNEIINNEREDV